MNRKELLERLEAVAPALAGNDLVPIYQCFVFDGKNLLAYNDAMAIMTPLDEIGEFAVNGKTLLGLLQNTGSEEVDLTLKDENLLIKAGKSNFKLPYFGPNEFLFEEPKTEGGLKIAITQELVDGIKTCLMTAANEEHMKKIAGVCINAADKALYSCDGDAITSYGLEIKGSGTYLLPNTFCQQVLKFGTGGVLHVNQDWACASFTSGYTLYGRLPDIGEPYDYAGQIESTLNEEPNFVDVPEELDAALARARVIADIESAPTRIKVAKGKLELVTSTHMGDVNDVLPLKGHGDVETEVHASLVHRSIGICNKMAILENCTAYMKDNIMQVVSNMGE